MVMMSNILVDSIISDHTHMHTCIAEFTHSDLIEFLQNTSGHHIYFAICTRNELNRTHYRNSKHLMLRSPFNRPRVIVCFPSNCLCWQIIHQYCQRSSHFLVFINNPFADTQSHYSILLPASIGLSNLFISLSRSFSNRKSHDRH